MSEVSIKNVDGTEHMMNDIHSAVTQSLGIMRNIVRNRAEDYAEKYVSSTLALEDSDPQKQTIKDQYIEVFVEKIRSELR